MIRSAEERTSFELEGPTWRQAYRILTSNRKTLLLPLAVTQLPATLIAAIAYFILLWRAFPEVEAGGLPRLGDEPQNYMISLIAINGAWWLFTLVGVAGTIVATHALTDGDALSLTQALDPGFTRLGGILAIGAIFLGLFMATIIGLFVLIYVIWRFGLALQQYVLGESGVYGALGRSWLLLRGRMLRFAGMLITLLPVSAVLLGVGVLAAGIVLLPFTALESGRTLDLATSSLGAAIIGVFAVPVSAYLAVATTLFYLNARADVDV